MATASPLSDLLDRLGVSPNRIRFHPAPGTATLQDVIDIDDKEDKLCELVEGVLVEKVVGFRESYFTAALTTRLLTFVHPRNLGIVMGPSGAVELMENLVRMPDAAFTNWDRFPGRRLPTVPIPRLAPNLAVEVLGEGNTLREMARKRSEYFAAGVELVWEIDLDARTVAVFTSPTQSTLLATADTLNGSTVLPGFTLPLQQLFAELDRHG